MKIVRVKKVVLATLTVLLIVLGEGCTDTSATSKSDSANTSANTVENGIASDPASTVENKIKTALTEKSTDLFQISDDYTFKSDVTGFSTQTTATSNFKTKLSIKTAWEDLSATSKGKLIRIKNGKATMDDSNFNCTMQILSNNQGISLSITEIGYSFISDQIDGIIKGNTFTASENYSQEINSKAVDSTLSVFGSYSVSMIEVSKNEWPPVAVTLNGKDNSDHSITLTWEDTNPTGLVKSYVIYRELGLSDAVKVATVLNCRLWTDSSTAAKTETSILSYYVTAQNSSGKESALSNYYDVNTAVRVLETD